jgi:mannose-1-phosphate guanylyltransferase
MLGQENLMLHAMIMAGGGGTRFWPRSRQTRPKQFLSFNGGRTLLQATVDRLSAQVPTERIWILTNALHRTEAVAQLQGLVPPNQVVGEPVGRDTAACIGLGAALIERVDAEATILVMPADHHIEPMQEFRRTVHAAELFANEFPHSLLTFGIPPTFPATAYGYIRRGEPVSSRQGITISRALGFREKPAADRAEEFVASGNYFWNSGIFVWKPATILAELERRKPRLFAGLMRIAQAWGTAEQAEVFRNEYEQLEAISIDYAVMQTAADEDKVLVIHAPFQWDDVGSWLALERRNPQDAAGNTVQALHCGVDTQNCVIVSDPDHLIGTLGVQDLIIIQNGNATLITTRQGESRIKELIEKLKIQGLGNYL